MRGTNALAYCVAVCTIIGCASGPAPSVSAKANQAECSTARATLACAEIEVLSDDTQSRIAQSASDTFLVTAAYEAQDQVGVGLASSTINVSAERIMLRQVSDVAFLSGGRDRKACRLIGERENEDFGKFCFYRCGRIEIARARSTAQFCPRRQHVDAAFLQSQTLQVPLPEKSVERIESNSADPITE